MLAPSAAARAAAPPVSARYPLVLVAALMVALALSFVDRQILALLVEPIKTDLRISDTTFGVLQGLAFALFYIGFGIPLGRMADRGNRRNLIVVGILLWSVATIACGTAGSFAALFAWRAGVGIGEAALSPAAYSMITDAVPKRRLSLALGAYNMGVYLGSGLALLVGGALLGWLTRNELGVAALRDVAPWRLVFVCVGLPGFAMAALLMLLPEPRRTHFEMTHRDDMPSPGETARFILGERRLFGGLILGFACHNTALYALLGWVPAFLGRHYHLSTSEVGAALGLSTMLGGGIGLILGGVASDRLFASGRGDAPLLVGMTSMAGIAAATLLTVFGGSAQVVTWAFGLVMVFVALPIGAAAAALQLVVPNRYRGQVSALYLISISLAGLTIGPIVPPLIGDRIFHDPARIGDALAITVVAAAMLSILLFAVGRPAYARRYAAIHLSPSSGDPS
ncbi:MFS transporter [uncultured Sphingomonas sp.]|jgi:MFS family permease|uniref:MFS transporter n=1 Tax=uncultured Sphingomonas sp. TaxID=158754 RepID=UPI0030DBF24B